MVASTVERTFEMDPHVVSKTIAMSCVYLHFLNSFNTVLLFLYRQKDFQLAAFQYLKCLFCRRKQSAVAIEFIGFTR